MRQIFYFIDKCLESRKIFRFHHADNLTAGSDRSRESCFRNDFRIRVVSMFERLPHRVCRNETLFGIQRQRRMQNSRYGRRYFIIDFACQLKRVGFSGNDSRRAGKNFYRLFAGYEMIYGGSERENIGTRVSSRPLNLFERRIPAGITENAFNARSIFVFYLCQSEVKKENAAARRQF